MKKNVGSTDKIIRIVLAAILGYLYFGGVVGGTLGYVALAVGIIALATALVNFCPLYTVINMNTGKK